MRILHVNPATPSIEQVALQHEEIQELVAMVKKHTNLEIAPVMAPA